MRAGLRRGLQGTDLVVLMVLVAVGACLLLPALMRGKGCQRPRASCSNQLRRIGLAAISYADDRRYFPGLATARGLAGGPESQTASRVMETLAYYDYLYDAEDLICPSSDDAPRPFRAYRGYETRARVPLHDPAPYSTLDESTQLSYGWTRRCLNQNARSTILLAADRAVRLQDPDSPPDPGSPPGHPGRGLRPGRVGNHRAGLNVLQVDGAVLWIGDQAQARDLVATDRTRSESGFLGIHDPTTPP